MWKMTIFAAEKKSELSSRRIIPEELQEAAHFHFCPAMCGCKMQLGRREDGHCAEV